MALGKKNEVKVLETWIETRPPLVVFPVKNYKPPKLETIEEEKEDKCEDGMHSKRSCRKIYMLLFSIFT